MSHEQRPAKAKGMVHGSFLDLAYDYSMSTYCGIQFYGRIQPQRQEFRTVMDRNIRIARGRVANRDVTCKRCRACIERGNA